MGIHSISPNKYLKNIYLWGRAYIYSFMLLTLVMLLKTRIKKELVHDNISCTISHYL